MTLNALNRIKARALLALANFALAMLPKMPSTRVEPLTVPPPIEPKWQALAGNHLELGSTGYIIKMQPGKGRTTYRLMDPEGDVLGRSEDLGMLKVHAEQLAKWRQEFTPAANGPVVTLLQLFMARGKP